MCLSDSPALALLFLIFQTFPDSAGAVEELWSVVPEQLPSLLVHIPTSSPCPLVTLMQYDKHRSLPCSGPNNNLVSAGQLKLSLLPSYEKDSPG